jgi:hypothetical protein
MLMLFITENWYILIGMMHWADYTAEIDFTNSK